MITRGIKITMTNKTTIQTLESPLTERHLHSGSAFGTSLTASSCLGVFNNLSTANYCFVGKHLEEISPRNIVYAFSEMMIFNHIFDSQLLDSNEGILFSEGMRKFMKEISSLVGNFEMTSSNPKPCLSPVMASFFLSAQSSLKSSKFIFRFNQESRIGDNFSIRESSEVLQANINPNLFFRRMLNFLNLNFTTKESEPLPCSVLLDSQSLNLTFRDSMQDNRDTSNLADLKSSLINEPESALRVCYAMNRTLESGKSFFLARFIFDSSEEVLKGFMNSVRDVLKSLGMEIGFFSSESIIIIKFPQSFSSSFVSFNVQGNKLVMNILSLIKHSKDFSELPLLRIDSILIRNYLLNHREYNLQDYLNLSVLNFGGSIHLIFKNISFLFT
jgi:hypothetical protein